MQACTGRRRRSRARVIARGDIDGRRFGAESRYSPRLARLRFSGRCCNVAREATAICGETSTKRQREKDIEHIESTFRVGRQNHLALEPRAVIASFEDGRFHIETSTQVPWAIKNATARFLSVPPSDVRVTVPPVGGGFGLKFDWALEPFAALLARAAGRSVRLVNSRREEMLTCSRREMKSSCVRWLLKTAIVGTRRADGLRAYGGEQILTTMTAYARAGIHCSAGAVMPASHAIEQVNEVFLVKIAARWQYLLERH